MVVKQDFLYPHCNEFRKLHIYLPEDYDRSDARYPVMYFFDGHNLFYNEDATYGKSWGLLEFLESWGKDMIIVGLECSHTGNQRLWEYLPYPGEIDRFGELKSWGEQTLRWIVEDIKPMIDRDFRTIPFRECTGIAGSSMGGLMALRAALGWNRWFAKAACVSSAIGFCMRPLMRDLRKTPISPDTRVYLSWGTREAWGIKNPEEDDRHSKTYSWNKKVADQILSSGAAVKMHCQIGGGHCEGEKDVK